MIGDVRRLEDTKLLYGAGGADMEGLTVRSGVIDIEENGLGEDTPSASTAQALLSAFASMASRNVQVNGAVMNPKDKYAMMSAALSGGADVAYNIVWNGDLMVFNGVPIITSTAVTAGDLIVGDWSASNAQIFQREGIRVSFSTEDATNFTDNKITVLVEERLALAVFRPAAYGYGQIADIKAALDLP
jgi:HK97 family phage major capsid protein